MTPSEALFGFMAWLTTREKPVTLSANHDAGVAADLVGEFCKANNLDEPRDNWTDYLTMPSA